MATRLGHGRLKHVEIKHFALQHWVRQEATKSGQGDCDRAVGRHHDKTLFIPDVVNFGSEIWLDEMCDRSLNLRIRANGSAMLARLSHQFRWCEELAQRTPNQKEAAVGNIAAKDKEQLLKNLNPQEVNSLMQSPRSDNRASGNRLRVCLLIFETLERDIQFARDCEDATLARRVFVGMSCKTTPDVEDGLGDRNPACRECTLPREDSNARMNATIPGQTKNWTSSSNSHHTISWHQRN